MRIEYATLGNRPHCRTTDSDQPSRDSWTESHHRDEISKKTIVMSNLISGYMEGQNPY